MVITPHIPRATRHTIGARIENKFLTLLELTYNAYFTPKEGKVEKISICITTLDLLKYLLQVAWEAKLFSHQHYAHISAELNESGKMLGAWKHNVEKNPEKKNRDL